MSRSDIIQTLREFKEQHAEEYGIQLMGLFGSVARDEATVNSDVDIVVKIEIPDPYIIVHIKEEISEQLQLSVDIVRLRDKMNPFLKKRIEQDIVYV